MMLSLPYFLLVVTIRHCEERSSLWVVLNGWLVFYVNFLLGHAQIASLWLAMTITCRLTIRHCEERSSLWVVFELAVYVKLVN